MLQYESVKICIRRRSSSVVAHSTTSSSFNFARIVSIFRRSRLSSINWRLAMRWLSFKTTKSAKKKSFPCKTFVHVHSAYDLRPCRLRYIFDIDTVGIDSATIYRCNIHRYLCIYTFFRGVFESYVGKTPKREYEDHLCVWKCYKPIKSLLDTNSSTITLQPSQVMQR